MNDRVVSPAPGAPRPRGTFPPRRAPPHSGGSGRAPSSLFASLSPSFSPPVVEGPRGGVDGTRNTFLNGIANCVTNLKPAATPGPCFVSGSYVTNKLTAAPLRLRNHSRGSFPTARGLAEASQNVSEEVPLHRHRLQLAPQPGVFRPLLARQRALRVLSLVDLRSLHPGPHARLCQPKLSRHGADALAAGPNQLHHLGLVLFRERPSRSRHGLHPPSHRRCPRDRGRLSSRARGGTPGQRRKATGHGSEPSNSPARATTDASTRPRPRSAYWRSMSIARSSRARAGGAYVNAPGARSRMRARIASPTPVTAAPSPDIRAFVNRGGKLIQYHGWNDSVVPPDGSVAYFFALTQFELLRHMPKAVADRYIEKLTPQLVAAMGEAFGKRVRQYHRLFM